MGAKISVGLVPDPAGNFVLPAIMLGERDDPKCASESAAQQVAAAREIVRIKHAGVSMRDDRVPLSRSLAVARTHSLLSASPSQSHNLSSSPVREVARTFHSSNFHHSPIVTANFSVTHSRAASSLAACSTARQTDSTAAHRSQAASV